MKTIFSLFTVMAVFTLVLAACGGGSSFVSEEDLISKWEHGSGIDKILHW